MLRSDAVAVEEAPINTLPLYRCPVCRMGSFAPTEDRPTNHSLATLVRETDGYEDLTATAEQERIEWVQQQQTQLDEMHEGGLAHPFDLPTLSKATRRRRAHDDFQKIIPGVIRAAARGLARWSITTRAGELAEVVDELAPLLFDYGVYSISSSAREFTVYITKPDHQSWSGEFINPDYSQPQSPAVPADEEEDNNF